MTAALKLDLSPRVFAAALLAAAVAIAGAGWYVVVSPKRDKVATLDAAIQADQGKLAAAAHAAAQPKGTAARAKREAAALGSALPDQVAMPQIVDQLSALADQSGVTLDTVTPTAALAGAGYYTVPLTVVVDGHFFDVKTFLRLVRNQVAPENAKFSASGRLFAVTGVELDQTEPAPTVTATLQMNAYTYAPGAAPLVPTTSTDSADTSTTPSGG